jgi:phosphonate transport system ATP-binding protein
MSVLSVRNLRVRYTAKGPEILKGIDFDVESDDFLAIIGQVALASLLSFVA